MKLDYCKSCGGDLERIGNYYVCKFCGNKWVIDADNDVHVIDRANAWSALRDCDFEKAAELFENIIYKEPDNHEAYWGRALSTNGIMYVTDLDEHKKVPTCNNISEDSFLESRDVEKAISIAPKDIAETYKKQATQIENIRVEWLKKARKEKPYDVFICFKDSDREHGFDRTDDSYDAHELYNALTEEGYKVFFSRVSLRDKVSEHYEPYIYNALKTAKVMIVFGEKPEYFNAVWVKNEWSRFRAMIDRGEKDKQSLVAVYKNMSPSELPVGLRSRQCLDAGEMKFLEILKQHIEKVISAPKPKTMADDFVPKAKEEKKKKKKWPVIAIIAGVLAVAITLGFVMPSLSNQPPITDNGETGNGTTVSGTDDSALKSDRYDVILTPVDAQLPKNTELTVRKITSTEAEFNSIKESLPDSIEDFYAYDMNLIASGEKVNPNGTVTVKVPLPSEIHERSAAVYHIGDNGFANEIPSRVENGYVSFDTTHFSIYVIGEKKGATVVFDANGGNGVMDSVILPYGDSFTLPENAFTRDGYAFAGWATSKNGTVSYIDRASYTVGTESRYTLYAVWENAPTVSLSAFASTNTSVSFTVTESDENDLGEITRIELWRDGEKERSTANVDVRSFDYLLSGTKYTVKVYYSYDLDDGKGEKSVVVSLDIATEAYNAPNVYVSEPTSSKTSIGFSVTENDENDLGEITKIELWRNGAKERTAESLDVRSFEDLLSGITYTVKVYYTYDLDDGAGKKSVVISSDITTKSYETPAVSIENITHTCTKINFNIVETDPDMLGNVEKIELLIGSTVMKTVTEDVYTVEFDSLLANTTYTVKVYYTYDMNDAVGAQTNEITASVKTDPYDTPTVSIANLSHTRTSIRFDIEEIDEFDLGSITKIELWRGEELDRTADNVNIRAFIGVLSNTAYTLKVYYTYDFHDGEGEKSTIISANVKTDAYSAPEVSIVTPSQTQTKVSFEIAENDTQNIGAVTNIELYRGEELVATADSIFVRSFGDLLSDTTYTVKVYYTYNLNDGTDDKVVVSTLDIKTSAYRVPTGKVNDPAVRYNGIDFELSFDIDSGCSASFTKVEILKGEEIVHSADGSTTQSFGGLLSATNYTVKYYFTYDLNDGNGARSGEGTWTFRTASVSTPSVSLTNPTQTYTSVGFEFKESDTNDLGAVTRIELYCGSELIATADSVDVRSFDGLVPNTVYTVKVYYAYDLCDGEGNRVIEKTLDIKTYAYAEPTLSIVNPTHTQTSIGFEIEETDEHDLGAVTKIELYRGTDLVATADSVDTRRFEGLLSNTTYTVKVSYAYSFSANTGTYSFEKTLDVTTDAYTVPTVSIINPTETQTSIGFEIDENDPDGIGEVEKIELYMGTELVATAANVDVRTFDGLLSNTTYTLKVSYSYSFSANTGTYSFEKTLDVTTDAYTIPTVSIINPTQTKTSIGFEIEEADEHDLGEVTKIELYKGTELIETAANVDVRAFEGLITGTTYTVKVYYTYDLNDGAGEQTIEAVLDIAPSIGLDYSVNSDGTTCTVTDIGTFTGTELVIPEKIGAYTVTKIGGAAFYGCKALTSIKIPDSVTSIGDRAFEDCTSLTSIEIPDGVTSIGDSVFSYCASLASVTIGNGVTSIGDRAFEDCTGLTSITVNSANTKYHSAGNCLIETESKTLILGCQTSVIPTDGSVTSIGNYAFRDCTSLTSINIPNSVTSIGDSVFAYCSGLTTVVIPDSVTSIGDFVFNGCSSLTSIVIPDSVTSIGFFAFEDCMSLEAVYYGGTESTWANISIESVNEYLTYATRYYYSEGMPTAEGNFWHYVDGVPTVWERFNTPTLSIVNPTQTQTSIGFEINENDPDGIGEVEKIELYKGTELIETAANVDVRAFEGLIAGTTYTVKVYYTYDLNDGSGEQTIEAVLDIAPSIGLDYSVNSDGTTCTVTGIGTFDGTELIIPEKIGAYTVTAIGVEAFRDCNVLTSVTIGNSVTSIRDRAFEGCKGLTSVTVGDSVTSIGWYSFSGCNRLANLTIGNNVTSIGNYAFRSCTELTSIVIPDSVTAIGENAFGDCDGLVSITVDSANTKYHGADNCIIETESKTLVLGCKTSVIPTDGSVTCIGNYAFYDCDGLTSIVIPNSVTSIGDYAFKGCTGLTSIDIPDRVTSIGKWAFVDCEYIISIVIPDNVTIIGEKAFGSCDRLKSVTIGNGVTSIENGAFSSLRLESITVRAGNTKYHSAGNCLIETESKTLILGCKTSVIPTDGSVTSIGVLAFELCTGTSIVIPNGVTTIKNNAFELSLSLTSIVIPSSVTSIGYEAFLHCNVFTTVYYGGTESDWANISIGYDNGILTNATRYYYSETTPTAEGNFWHYVDGVPTVWTAPALDYELDSGNMTCTITGIGSFEGTDLVIPRKIDDHTVTKIGDTAFYRCTGLTSVVIPDSVTSIGADAFSGCSSLARIEIPASVVSIGNYAFKGCYEMKDLYIGSVEAWCKVALEADSSHPFYLSETSERNLYVNGEKVTELIIPDGVTSIGYYTFLHCTGLTSIVIPSGVTSIRNSAFERCSKLATVYYGGASSDWTGISIGSSNDAITYATRYYYSEGTPTTDGNFWHYVGGVPTKW